MNTKCQQVFQKELLKEEKMLWCGQPDTSVVFTKADIFFIPFSILWGGFAILWFIIAIIEKAPFFFILWGIPFVAIGFYFIFGRFVYKKKKKERTYYAITNKRILILSKNEIEGAYINTIPVINKTIHKSGMGTIRFGNADIFSSMYGNAGMDFFGSFYYKGAPVFYDVKEAQKVYDIVNDIRNS